MLGARIVLLSASLVVLCPAQTQLFQALDGPVPQALGGIDAVADFDGDGDIDLLGPGGIAVNDSHGRFTLTPAIGLPTPRGRTLAADVNGDGLPDVVSLPFNAIGTYGGLLRIDINVGGFAFAAAFAPLPTIPSPYFAANFALGDVDGDGDADILIGTEWVPSSINAGPAELWINSGSASFTAVPSGILPGASVSAEQIMLRDLDGDGDLDALVAGSTGSPPPGIRVLTNTGTSMVITQSILAYVYSVEIGNFNGDAFPDLVYVDYTAGVYTLVVRLGSATGFLTPVTSPLPNGAITIRALDLSGDGLDEIVVRGAYLNAPVTVHSVTAAGILTAPTQSWSDLALAPTPGGQVVPDLDGDGDRDLLAISGNGDVVLLMNGGTGSLVRIGGRVAGCPVGNVSPAANLIQAADLDADGDRDILELMLSGWMATLLADGDGFFTGGIAISMVPSYLSGMFSLYTFDRDGDGDADLLATPNVSSTGYPYPHVASVLDNAGGVTFTTFAYLGPGPTSVSRAADFDGDGDQDLILGRRGNSAGVNWIWGPTDYVQNLGAGGFAPAVPIGAGHATFDLAVADFDGNGTLDVFQANKDTATPGGFDPCVLYVNSGGGTFTASPTAFSGLFVAAGDLNGDGLPDLVLDTLVLINAGAGGFNPGPPLPAPLLGPTSLADVDGDGDLDIVEAPARVMFNNGALLFSPPVSYLPLATGPFFFGNSPESFVFDVDKDGDLDLVAPGPVLLLNTTRQIARGSIARPGRPASIDLYGTPGGAWFLWGSGGTTSLPLPPLGTVLIDPASAQLGAMGQFTGPTTPLPGTSTVSVLVPNSPALVGWTTWWQSVDATQMRLTNRIPITVMGY